MPLDLLHCGSITRSGVAEITGVSSSIVSFKQGLEETILSLKGDTPDRLAQQA
jgi:hypothetical protein